MTVLFRQQIEVNPDHDMATYQLGLLLVQAGQYQEAVVLLERAVEMAPEDTERKEALKSAKEWAER